jgi:3D (Asp-Asp-Asp) domain-containing protein
MRTASYKPSSTGKDPADPAYGITATGEKLRKGIVAVDPNVIPLGTKLYIPGYGFALAADTGGLVSGRVIDLGYSDEDYKAWSGSVDIFLLVPAPPPDEVPLLPEEPVQP